MSEQIEIELSEETSQMVHDKYESVKDNYESFDEYVQDLNTWLNLKMKETNLKGELKDIQKKIHKLDMKFIRNAGDLQ